MWSMSVIISVQSLSAVGIFVDAPVWVKAASLVVFVNHSILAFFAIRKTVA